MKVYISLNETANNGSALNRWKLIRDDIFEYYSARNLICEVLQSKTEIETILSDIVDQEKRILLIAAGGDGTVNYLLNRVMDKKVSHRIMLGAIGLGSSNDFHKPFAPGRMIKRIPVKINPTNAKASDVGLVTFLDESGETVVRHFIINSSLGMTAEGNFCFNSNDAMISFLKSKNVTLAIWVSFFKSLTRHKNIRAYLTLGNQTAYKTEITNLGIIKNVHFTGNLKYDTTIQPDDGTLGVNLIEYATIFDQLRILRFLLKGKFGGLPKTKVWVSQQVRIDVDQVAALETDGEVFRAKSIEYAVLPKALSVIV